MSWGSVELEPEIRGWLEGLSPAHFSAATFYIELLAEKGPLLGEPHTKQLRRKLRELRFYLDGEPVRITYWIAPGRRIVLLTAFRKTRMRENREVDRAWRAFRLCLSEGHSVDEDIGE
ncbi:type II toxin-antitoxin system RelE/ParE family toxin [Saccharopolyspora indica]|uniref:type II toxin-antitoxin system RelE/ParE family toxin n=1 Tax=Saccharopolyspora indica TaxID=1229659 RepID=UPI0022EACD12|nr:type II toxin-antitoxin system RelE/ParE family toxin [Saccharopolyspora indica]MDA3649237.1 type II toxin-antitoxin system RelE/ParE family toxin [Saccharopolyspora indica]